ncbi:FkbM family methyltransferase [Saccharopolyspora flava]|uniref:Methyltransferase, FkbM family n=1 Tax=Saccharopolyspora flava TaxID=95161 RepID=A0A1I6TNK7_9PSEU|nr:FkbM family methyltransferase [Saccharopolyspora flava]SFS90755.1 methyltransferase, FkbM family [Saccharopolyspora flava]
MAEIRQVQVAGGFEVSVPQPEEVLLDEIQFIYNEIFVERTYLRHGIRLSESARVVDVGANVGMFCLFVAKEFPGTRILAFEPIPATHRALRENLDRHGVSGAEVVRAALGSRPEERVTFTFYPALHGNSTRYPEQKKINQDLIVEQIGPDAVERIMGAVEVEAEVRRLSDVLRDWEPEGRIDLLKVDVEGAELEVLQGLDEPDWQRIQQCVLEVQDFDDRLNTILELLHTHGFTTTVEPAPDIPETLRQSMVYAIR